MGERARSIGRVRRRGDRGAAAVEFALLVPVLCLLLFGIISYGVMLSFRQSLTQAATEGARAAAVAYVDSDRQSDAYAAINDATSSFGVTCSDTGVLQRGGVDVGTCTVTPPGDCVPVATDAQCVTVTLSYDYDRHPLVPSFPGVGAVLPDTLTYSAQARVS